MVRPAHFGFNDDSAQTNSFQHKPKNGGDVQSSALEEFDKFIEILQGRGIDVTVINDTPSPKKPDAIFPNNWFSTWPNGNIYLYPMEPIARRAERRPEIFKDLKNSFNIIDLSANENENKFLESTGAIVFDHMNKVAYGAISPRCNKKLFLDHCKQLGYKPMIFHTSDPEGKPIYHTNVLMGIQTSTAVVCSEIINKADREKVLKELKKDREVVEITFAQLTNFAGNVLEVQNSKNEKFLILSGSAHKAFTPKQREILGKDKTLLPIAIPTIEKVGGGSVRCMIAENFLT